MNRLFSATMPRYQRLYDFSTADAQLPSLSFRRGDLVVEFEDWQERKVRITFRETVAFWWRDEPNLASDVSEDSSYEVLDSDWIRELVEQRAISDSSDYKEYLLCFNDCGGALGVVSHQLLME
jgi:hypothetical protein